MFPSRSAQKFIFSRSTIENIARICVSPSLIYFLRLHYKRLIRAFSITIPLISTLLFQPVVLRTFFSTFFHISWEKNDNQKTEKKSDAAEKRRKSIGANHVFKTSNQSQYYFPIWCCTSSKILFSKKGKNFRGFLSLFVFKNVVAQPTSVFSAKLTIPIMRLRIGTSDRNHFCVFFLTPFLVLHLCFYITFS